MPASAPSSSTITPRRTGRGQRGVERRRAGSVDAGDACRRGAASRGSTVAAETRAARPSRAGSRSSSTTSNQPSGARGLRLGRRWRRGARSARRSERQLGRRLEAEARGSPGHGRRSRPRSRRPGAPAGVPGRPAARACPPTRSTATWSPSLMASSMSWVTKTIVLPSSPCRRRNSSCSCSRTTGSTARERLVHQHHRRVGRQRTRDADALLLAAGELAGVALGERRVEADALEQLHRAGHGPSSCPSRAARAPSRCCRATVRCGNRPACWIT